MIRHAIPFVLCMSFPLVASAQDPVPPPADAPSPAKPEPEKTPKPPPFRYSIPFQLRPAAVPNVIRSDTTSALHRSPDGTANGSSTATMLLGAVQITPSFGLMARFGLVQNTPPSTPTSQGNAVALVNPALGATYLVKLDPAWRAAFFLGVTAPVGMGGGESPNKDTAAAAASGVLARSGMDNAMFAVNYLTVFPGASIAWVKHGLTVQAEVTVLQLIRARGPSTQEGARTNFTSGVHVGYFVIPALSIGTELRYQRFLKNDALAGTAAMDNVTWAAGVRGHFEIADKAWLRPGVAYARGLDAPMTTAKYHIIQADIVLML